ncbi:hypothetical protein ACROYT_G014769 [Oculina patagonica]
MDWGSVFCPPPMDLVLEVDTEFEMFVKNASAAELGTSRASMNRIGKFNAAKGVKTHYNEYKDFHSREVEVHICSSFMEMCGMSKIDVSPSSLFYLGCKQAMAWFDVVACRGGAT